MWGAGGAGCGVCVWWLSPEVFFKLCFLSFSLPLHSFSQCLLLALVLLSSTSFILNCPVVFNNMPPNMFSWSVKDQIPIKATLKFILGISISPVLFPIYLISFPLATPVQDKFIRDFTLLTIADCKTTITCIYNTLCWWWICF